MAKSELRSMGGMLTDLHRVLEGWCDLQSKYAQIEDEPAYDHTEAANTSLLVSAANAIDGWTGIAELRIPKRDAESSKTKNGRLDAYIANEEYGYVIEFKQVWMTGKDFKTEVRNKRYKDLLSKAKRDVRELKFKKGIFDYDACKFLHGAFFVISHDPAKVKRKKKALFDDLVQHCDSKFDAFAVFSPALKKEDLIRHIGKNKWYRPIVALGLKELGAAKNSRRST